MNSTSLLGGMLLIAGLASCTAEVPQRGSGTNLVQGVIEAIARQEAPASSGAPGDAGVAGVATVLASGSLSTPPGAPPATGAKGGGTVAAVASAMASPGSAPASNQSAFRVSVRLDSGVLKTIDQPDVSALSVGQRVRLQGNRVVPQ